MSEKVRRLAVVNSHPIQYFVPLYRRIAKESSIDLTVFYCSRQGVDEYLDPGFGARFRWDPPLLEGYRSRFLRNLRRSDQVVRFASLINPGIVRVIARGGFDAVWVHGYNYVSHLLALGTARLVGTPVMYRAESSLTYDSRVRRPFHVRLLKPPLLRLLFRQVSAFLSIGTLNREFYIRYGAPPERVFPVPYTVDNNFFAVQVDRLRSERERMRTELHIGPNDIVFLFAAKMTHQKAPLELLQAYTEIPHPNRALLMAGDGELRGEVEAFVRARSLSSVHLFGFVNQSELPRLYAISDVLVRPDGVYKGDWGLTVNEAMASGLAIIATEAIGAVADLVRNGVNGYVIPFLNAAELVGAMSDMARDPERSRIMGRRSQKIISTWSNEECVQGLLAALNYLDLQRGKRILASKPRNTSETHEDEPMSPRA